MKDLVDEAVKVKELRTLKKQEGKNIKNAIAKAQKVNVKIQEKEEEK